MARLLPSDMKKNITLMRKGDSGRKMENQGKNEIAFLNRDVIKYIAMFTMLLNHIAHIFMTEGSLYNLFVDIGYFTAPVMCYFLVEGYHYTRSKKKYAIRLLIFAIISQIPFSLAFEFGNLNMIYTLFICFLILVAGEKIQNPLLCNVVKIALMLVTIIGDWALLAALCTILLEKAWGDKKKQIQSYWILYGLFVLMDMTGYLQDGSGMPLWQIIARTAASEIAVLCAGYVVCYLYNGKRMAHAKNFSKWFFYIFYPGHLLILWAIRTYIL
jgi:hypothetical protein